MTVNNGFKSPTAIENAHHVTDKLKVDLLVSNSGIDEFVRRFRQAFLELQGRGSYGVVDFVDGTLIYETGEQLARHLNIPLLIGGLSWVQVNLILKTDDFQQGDAPRQVFPLAVWRTNEQEIRRTVREQKLMLPGSDSPVVSNSSLILAMSVADAKNSGYSSFEPEFAQLVREGKADRSS